MPRCSVEFGSKMKRLAQTFLLIAGVLAASSALAPAQEAAKESSGVFGDIGRWFDKSMTSIGDQFRNAGKNIDQFNHEAGVAAKTTASAATDAAGSVARIPGTRVVSGRQNCPVADNGSPDCAAAADRLCRAKGHKSGTSLDVTSARECPTRALLQKEARAECKDVTVVTRAMCR